MGRPAFTALSGAFAGESANGVELLEADFRGTMCRLKVAFDPSRVEESFRSVADVVPWAGKTFFHAEDESTGEAIVYISREDHSLPRVEE